MDVAVDQFQAFDLAVVPTGTPESSDSTSRPIGGGDADAETAAVPASVDTPGTSTADRKGPDEQPMRASAAMPAVAVVALLSRPGKAIRRRSTRFLLDLFKRLTR
jgi:hypothetical protein